METKKKAKKAKKAKTVVNPFVTIQAIAKGIESKASIWHEEGKALFKALNDEVDTLTAAGAQGVDIVASLDAYPVCKSTVRAWINRAKPDEEKNPKQKGQPSKSNRAKGKGKEAGDKAKSEGFTRSRIITNVIIGTIQAALGDDITDETSIEDALKIAKAACSSLGRADNKILAKELASVDAKPEPETEPTEPTPEDVADIIDNAEADAEPDTVDVRDAVPELV